VLAVKALATSAENRPSVKYQRQHHPYDSLCQQKVFIRILPGGSLK
jgi:hypothetical protein